MSDQTTETTVDTTAPATTEQVQLQLQLQDLLSAVQIIQLASSRGAFRAEEFTLVGGVYERIASFLQSSGALTPPAGEQQADGTAPADQAAE